jgi:hypothetical protein
MALTPIAARCAASPAQDISDEAIFVGCSDRETPWINALPGAAAAATRYDLCRVLAATDLNLRDSVSPRSTMVDAGRRPRANDLVAAAGTAPWPDLA